MKISIAVLVAVCCATYSDAFAPIGSVTRQHQRFSSSRSAEKKTDDYDDWYADFNPAEYEVYNQQGYGGDNRGSGTSQKSYSGSSNASHDYTREDSDTSQVNTGVVDQLIAERTQLRKTGQFDAADAIREDLLQQHGVMMRDKDRTWRSGCSANGSGRNWFSGKDNDRGGGDRRGGGRNDRNDRRRPPKEFGPRGHDYQMAPDASANTSTLTEGQIDDLVAERLQCKLNRDFGRADGIQAELFQAGVVVHDGFKQWRADGQEFPGFGLAKYERSPEDSEDLSDDEVAKIEDLIEKRAKAKSERVYRFADEIKDELLQEFEVQVNDRSKQWAVGGNFGFANNRKEFPSFSRAPHSPVPDNNDEIQELVEQRDTSRAKRDFQAADSLRDKLLDLGVYIDDKNRQWSMAGAPDAGGWSDGGNGASDAPYRCQSKGSLSQDEVTMVEELIAERDTFKQQREFSTADEIRERLNVEFQVGCNDRRREWYKLEYFVTSDSAPLDADTLAIVKAKLEERAASKLTQDYATADAMRDDLLREFMVSVNDREQTWTKLSNEHANDKGFDGDLGESLEADGKEEPSASDIEEAVLTMDEDEDETSEVEEELSGLTVPELKERLKSAGLPVSGRKAELIERLQNV